MRSLGFEYVSFIAAQFSVSSEEKGDASLPEREFRQKHGYLMVVVNPYVDAAGEVQAVDPNLAIRESLSESVAPHTIWRCVVKSRARCKSTLTQLTRELAGPRRLPPTQTNREQRTSMSAGAPTSLTKMRWCTGLTVFHLGSRFVGVRLSL